MPDQGDIFLNIYRKMSLCRFFEENIIKNKDRIKCPVYLSMGQESVAATVSEVYPDAKVFPQHRCHSWYLSYGGSPERLRDELLGLESGCGRGMGGSSDIGCEKVEAHHGLIGENVPIATGYALASGKLAIAVLGDGAIEEDYVGVAFGFASTHNLNVIFVCEDNNLAILTPKRQRRSWSACSMAEGYGLAAFNVSDEPSEIISVFGDAKPPFLINIRTTRHKWHVGYGEDHPPLEDRLAEMSGDVSDIKERVNNLWL